MRVCIHRGSKQIGGSCVEVESDGQRILLDFGLPLDAEDDHGQYLPRIEGLKADSAPSLLGIFISHPHLDHFGLLHLLSQKISIGMGAAAHRILEAAAPFLPGEAWRPPLLTWPFVSGTPIEVGPFRVTPFLADHSAYDAYSLLIEADGKRLLYSGDLRAHGRKAVLFERLISQQRGAIDTLLLEGSSLGRLDDSAKFPSESDIETELTQVFNRTDGLALVHTSIQNIDRLVSIFRACRRSKRTLVIDLYAAAVLEATQSPKIPQSHWPDVALFIPDYQRRTIKQNAWFELLKRHSTNRIFIDTLQKAPQRSALLFRPIHCLPLEKANCLGGAAYIYSQWEGYWEQDSNKYLRDWLQRQGLAKLSIHTSGHASPTDLKRFVTALSPRKVVPIHTFMPDRYTDLFSNAELHEDGDWWSA